MEARPDPIVERFSPDRELVARAQNEMMDRETAAQRYRRQQWEHALGAARVVLDSLRDIWPSERLALGTARDHLAEACDNAEVLVIELDALSPVMLGDTMVAVLQGEITSHEELDRWIGPLATPSEAAPEAPRTRSKAHQLLAYVCEHPGQHPPDMNGLEATLDQLVEHGWIQMQPHTPGGEPQPHPTPKALDSFPEFADLEI